MIHLHESLIYLAAQNFRSAHDCALATHQQNCVTPMLAPTMRRQRINKARIGVGLIAALVTLVWIVCCLFAVTASAAAPADEWRIFTDVEAPYGATHAVRFVRGNDARIVGDTQFDFSLDGNTWSSINTPADSELGFFTPPKGVNFYMRVRIPEKSRDGASRFFEQVKQFWLPVGHAAADGPMTWMPIGEIK